MTLAAETSNTIKKTITDTIDYLSYGNVAELTILARKLLVDQIRESYRKDLQVCEEDAICKIGCPLLHEQEKKLHKVILQYSIEREHPVSGGGEVVVSPCEDPVARFSW